MDRKTLGELLLARLNRNYDVVEISRWALKIYSNYSRELTPDMHNLLEHLFSMEDDPQFEYTEDELRLLAGKLINDESNAIDKINQMKPKFPENYTL